jgi:hypothetical protein
MSVRRPARLLLTSTGGSPLVAPVGIAVAAFVAAGGALVVARRSAMSGR